jgi:cold shock CspA family protein
VAAPKAARWQVRAAPLQITARSARMPQGTIKQFDIETNTGIVVLDDTTELPIDAQTFARSGLLELRLGQRVRFDLTGSGEERSVRNLDIVSL